MSSLNDIIGSMDLEAKIAIAVNMYIKGIDTKDICNSLNVSNSFVSKWKVIYENEGSGGLRVKYEGGAGYLTEQERSDVIFHFSDKHHCSVKEVRDYIESNYGVVYRSKQSYYDIMREAGLSWHRTQAANPKRNEDKVIIKREEIKNMLEERQAEIVSGELVVFAEDESHLLWGDVQGYVWGKRNERTEVPIENSAERQTYYGVLNIYTGDFIVKPYSCGNGEITVSFIEHLRSLNVGKKIIILWDGASHHRCNEVKDYLNGLNSGIKQKDWKVNCIPFASYAPDQNPVEDVWLKGKNFLRKNFYKNRTFNQVKDCFFNYLDEQIFKFGKLDWYISFPQPV